MSSCPPNPPPPDGYKIWRDRVPRPLSQWAVDLRDHWMQKPSTNYGDTVGLDLEGEGFVVARKDHHTWTYKNGRLVTGLCIPGITLYKPLLTQALGGPPGMGDVVSDSLTTPDPNVAAYTQDQGTNWGLVGWSALAASAVVAAFVAGIHFAGQR